MAVLFQGNHEAGDMWENVHDLFSLVNYFCLPRSHSEAYKVEVKYETQF